jgi:hypothetical protein
MFSKDESIGIEGILFSDQTWPNHILKHWPNDMGVLPWKNLQISFDGPTANLFGLGRRASAYGLLSLVLTANLFALSVTLNPLVWHPMFTIEQVCPSCWFKSISLRIHTSYSYCFVQKKTQKHLSTIVLKKKYECSNKMPNSYWFGSW